MKKPLLLLAIAAVCFAADEPEIAGDWKGTLKTPFAELRLVLHVTKFATDQLSATLDSVDQGANGIPVASVSLEGNHLKLDVAAVKGLYDAQVSEDGKTIAGRWSQGGGEFPLSFTRAEFVKSEPEPPADSATVAPLVGIWEGTIDTGAMKLRVRFTLVKNDKGAIAGKFDSIDQGASGIPMSGLSLKGSDFHFDLKGVGGQYDGKVTADHRSIKGKWQQAGNTIDLDWKKVDKPTALNRPQEPKKPYPYREEDVRYANPRAAGVELAGTLTLPDGPGPFPAVVLISGSGPQDRDEAIMGHRPFLVLADHLTRNGIAVLRFDDRGTNKSKGNFAKATSADFATDALAGVDFLKSRPEIDAKKIGLVGHSEGGVAGPIAAVQSTDVAFLVLIAGPGVPADRLLQDQQRLILKAIGKSDAEIEKADKQLKEAFTIVHQEKDSTAALAKIKAMFTMKEGEPPAFEQRLKMLTTDWFRYLLAYDPAAVLMKVKTPVLALNGEKDLQVEPKSNLGGIRAAFEKGGNKNVTIVELPGLNHLLQTSQTGSIAEYASIEETMNPAALELMSNWIRKTAGL